MTRRKNQPTNPPVPLGDGKPKVKSPLPGLMAVKRQLLAQNTNTDDNADHEDEFYMREAFSDGSWEFVDVEDGGVDRLTRRVDERGAGGVMGGNLGVRKGRKEVKA